MARVATLIAKAASSISMYKKALCNDRDVAALHINEGGQSRSRVEP
jgi:hypothetical protein